MEETVGGGELPAWARRGLCARKHGQKRLQRTRRQYFPAHQHNEPEPPRCHRPFMTSADTVNRSVSTISIVRQRTCHRRSYGPGRPKLSLFSLSPGQPTQLTVLTVVFEGNWGPDGATLARRSNLLAAGADANAHLLSGERRSWRQLAGATCDCARAPVASKAHIAPATRAERQHRQHRPP